MNSDLIVTESAMSIYADRDDVRELGDRLMAMHPAAKDVGTGTMRAAAQMALLLGANPLPGVNELHVWVDNKGRPCLSLGINYWRRKAQEWGGFLYRIEPRQMKPQERVEYSIPDGVIAAICKGIRVADMIRFKELGFPASDIWDMCGRTGIATAAQNDYAKSGRPLIWTALKRAETDMLRKLFPAEFGNIERQVSATSGITVIHDAAEETAGIVEVDGMTVTEEFNNDFIGPDNDQQPANPNPSGRLYADGSFVDNNPKVIENYDAYREAHNGNAPDNVHNLRNWFKSQNGSKPAPVAEAVEAPLFPLSEGAYEVR